MVKAIPHIRREGWDLSNLHKATKIDNARLDDTVRPECQQIFRLYEFDQQLRLWPESAFTGSCVLRTWPANAE